VPEEYRLLILTWIRFNRRNSNPIPTSFLDLILSSANLYGKFHLSNRANLDKPPLPCEYLTGRRYNSTGTKTVWVKETRSSWNKHQATLILCILADGFDRILPVLIFHGTRCRLGQEKTTYDPHIRVLFNPTAYSNEFLFLVHIEDFLIPAFQGRPSLFVMDVAEFHKPPGVLAKLRLHHITHTLIPTGCTGLVQPHDVSVNCLFKDIL